MAGFSFWRRVARLWPQGRSTARARPRLPRAPLWLEQLGDRTLLSATGWAYGPRLLPVVIELARPPMPEGGSVVTPANPLGAQAAGTDAGDADAYGHRTVLPPGGLIGGPPGRLNYEQAPLAAPDDSSAMLQELYVTRAESGDDRGDYREYDMLDRAMSDRTVLGFLLRPYVTDRDDRRDSAGEGTNATGGAADDLGRPDGAGLDFTLADRADGPAIARSLAAVFREELPGDEAFGENPAGKMPDVLVSYEPDLLAPQAELLPLEDGSRALVAALVAGVPQRAPSPDAADSRESPAGAAVGIDSGPPVAEGVAWPAESQPPAGPESPADAAPQPQAALDHRPASVEHGRLQADPEDGGTREGRTAVRLLDALFAGGAFSLFYLADHYGARAFRAGFPCPVPREPSPAGPRS
jgi:hypothetical protein